MARCGWRMIGLLGLIIANLAAGADVVSRPATLTVAARVELGAVDPTPINNGVRWCQQAVTRDGSLWVFYADAKHQIVYRRSSDGRTFAEPVAIGTGSSPAVAVDDDDMLFVTYRADNRVVLQRLAKSDGSWGNCGKPVDISGQFGDGAAQFPSLLILPGSSRVWCMYGYVPSDLAGKPNVGDTRKSKAHPLITYSDDRGNTWAPPRFVGSDSGDTGSGVAALVAFRGQPAWFWTFWDCATPAWGFFDGTSYRGFREFFPHVKTRMAVGHPWDAAEDSAGRLYFATGMHTPGQVVRVFDGSQWSDELWLSDRRGTLALLTDGAAMFCATAEGKAMSLFQLDGAAAAPRPDLYSAPEGKTIQRPLTLHGNRRPAGYIPLFLVEATPKDDAGKTVMENLALTYLRLEVKPLAASEVAAAGPAIRPPGPTGLKVNPLPLKDDRIEPRTDSPKDRKIVRVGDRWVIVYADDNPGRLMAVEIVNGKCGKPIALTDKPGWNVWQCAAVADGDDAVQVVAASDRGMLTVRMAGIKDWGKTPPKISTHLEPVPGGVGWAGAALNERGKLAWAFVTRHSPANNTSWSHDVTSGDDSPTFYGYGRGGLGSDDGLFPALLSVGGKVMSLLGDERGLMWGIGIDASTPFIKEPWIGPHFSAMAEGNRADVIYAPSDSYLGKRIVGHARFENGAWKEMPPVDEGHVVKGLSLCGLGGGRLLAVYAVRSDRAAQTQPGEERLKRFTYALMQRTFDGKAWSAARKVAQPEIPKYRPENWKDANENGGVIYIPEADLARYPTLPANAPAGAKSVPVAWMAPGFHCMPKKERSAPDRGGLLVTTEISLDAVPER